MTRPARNQILFDTLLIVTVVCLGAGIAAASYTDYRRAEAADEADATKPDAALKAMLSPAAQVRRLLPRNGQAGLMDNETDKTIDELGVKMCNYARLFTFTPDFIRTLSASSGYTPAQTVVVIAVTLAVYCPDVGLRTEFRSE